MIFTQSQSFAHRHIPYDRWDRFAYYANRVREFECTDAVPVLHYQSFSTLSISRPLLHVIPNLTHLTWKRDPARPAVSLAVCLLFLTPGLKNLSVVAGEASSQGDLSAIESFFQDVVRRSPQIENFEFRSDIPFRNLGPVLSNLVVGLPQLKTILLSETLLSSDVITALARCPLLEVVKMATSGAQLAIDDLQNFMPVLEHGAFPNIKKMDMKAHLWNVAHFFQSAFPGSRLQHLFVRTLSPEKTESVGLFFELIAETCINIQSLALSIPHGSPEEDDSKPLPFSSWTPLLRCKYLSNLTLNIPMPLNLDDTQAKQIAQCWPQMQRLELKSHTLDRWPSEVYPSLATLVVFAQHCLELRSLAIYIHSSVIPELKFRKMFRKLDTLDMGLTGTGYSPEDFAVFLTDIVPPTCVVTGTAFPPVYHAQSKLDGVLKMLPMIRSIHAQYRKRLRTLEDEVQRVASAAGPVVG